MKRRGFALVVPPAIAAASLGCPSLDGIGIGTDAASDIVASDRSGDVAAREAQAPEAAHDAKACTSDVESDPRNCGRCAHDCNEGACQGGVCQPYAIVTGNAGPNGITVANRTVYFTSVDDTLETCMADDCMNTLTVMTNGQATPRGITSDATSIYWANEGLVVDGGLVGSIATCGLLGCAGGFAHVLAPMQVGPYDVVVGSGIAYWTDNYGKAVRSCSVAGCSGEPTTLAADPTLLSGIAIDVTSVYWAEESAGNIIKCPLGGCTTLTQFATGQSQPTKLDVANDTLFWSTSGAIMSCPTSGCVGAPHVFASGQSSAYAIAHDATTLYWSLYEPAGKVLACTLAGCAMPTVLGALQDLPSAIAVDDSSVYWTNSGGGAVMRVMK
jgi:hypothetical protein